jgi:hypothetical protein
MKPMACPGLLVEFSWGYHQRIQKLQPLFHKTLQARLMNDIRNKDADPFRENQDYSLSGNPIPRLPRGQGDLCFSRFRRFVTTISQLKTLAMYRLPSGPKSFSLHAVNIVRKAKTVKRNQFWFYKLNVTICRAFPVARWYLRTASLAWVGKLFQT